MLKMNGNLTAQKLSNRVFFYVLIKRRVYQMAKYLDQTGAQHLAEALMASTKTVGGQTIWGSGNIETDGLSVIDITDPSEVNFDGQIAFYRLNYTGDQAPWDTYIGYAMRDNSDRRQLNIMGVNNHRQYIVEISDTVIWNEIINSVPTFYITSWNDVVNNQNILQDNSAKNVVFGSKGQTSSCSINLNGDVTIKNATIYTPVGGVTINISPDYNLRLDTCSGSCINLGIQGGSTVISKCNFTFSLNSSNPLISGGELSCFYSTLGSVAPGINDCPIYLKDATLGVRDSKISNFVFYNNCTLNINPLSHKDNEISTYFKNCDFSKLVSTDFSLTTLFKCVGWDSCILDLNPSIIGSSQHVYNLQHCCINNASSNKSRLHPWTSESVSVDATVEGGYNLIK